MKDKLLHAVGVVIGLIACILLGYVCVIGVIFTILWIAITFILLGLWKLESLLKIALTGEEPEGDMLDEMITVLKNIKKSAHE